MKPTMPIARVGKPENPNMGQHIIPPDNDDKTPAYGPSAFDDEEQLGPHIIKCKESTHQYQTRS
eukprot:5140038-Ditylum_brightwellii.AAC.1